MRASTDAAVCLLRVDYSVLGASRTSKLERPLIPEIPVGSKRGRYDAAVSR